MALDEKQKAELSKPLDSRFVSERRQGGVRLSYIEAHYAIRRANEIFGFDGWTRETIDARCVSERQRMIGKEPHQYEGWGVSYTIKVRITAGGVAKDGFGSGHGIDRDCGLAHESAIKEAESDATKRALMTFGDQFGLALYDKDKTHVVDGAVQEQQEAKRKKAEEWTQGFIASLEGLTFDEACAEMREKDRFLSRLPDDLADSINEAVKLLPQGANEAPQMNGSIGPQRRSASAGASADAR